MHLVHALIKHLLSARHCPGHWEFSTDRTDPPCPEHFYLFRMSERQHILPTLLPLPPSRVLNKNSIHLPVMPKCTPGLMLVSSFPVPKLQLPSPGWSSYSFSSLTPAIGPHNPGIQAPDPLPIELSASGRSS